jgi:hypothetical protein
MGEWRYRLIFLNLAVDGDEWSDSCPVPLPLMKELPVPLRMGDEM